MEISFNVGEIVKLKETGIIRCRSGSVSCFKCMGSKPYRIREINEDDADGRIFNICPVDMNSLSCSVHPDDLVKDTWRGRLE